MLTETGKVIAVDADGAWVETLQQSACNQCRARHGCGQKLVATAESRFTCVKALYSKNLRAEDLSVGDGVTIGVEEALFVRGTLFSYGLPLVFMMVSLWFISQFTQSEPLLVIATFASLLAGGVFVRLSARTLRPKGCLHATLLKINYQGTSEQTVDLRFKS